MSLSEQIVTDAEIDEIARRIGQLQDADPGVVEKAKEDVAYQDAPRLMDEIRRLHKAPRTTEAEQRLIRAAGEVAFEQRQRLNDFLSLAELELRSAWVAWRAWYRTTPEAEAEREAILRQGDDFGQKPEG